MPSKGVFKTNQADQADFPIQFLNVSTLDTEWPSEPSEPSGANNLESLVRENKAAS